MTGYSAFSGVQFAGAALYEKTAFYDWQWLSGLMLTPQVVSEVIYEGARLSWEIEAG